MTVRKPRLTALAIATAMFSFCAARAQLPPGVYAGQPDASLAPAGDYGLDPDHTAVIAKVSHIGYSISVFRFNQVEGKLHWDTDATSDKLEATVETASITTPVAGFAAELAGPEYLNSKKFPQAQFISTRFVKVDATHALVEGRFTLLGKTVLLTFNVELIGAGKGFMGHPRIGVEATGTIKTADFGLPAVLGPTVQLDIDTEFSKLH
jgi:polyisoprenoid-binding protein YceI